MSDTYRMTVEKIMGDVVDLNNYCKDRLDEVSARDEDIRKLIARVKQLEGNLKRRERANRAGDGVGPGDI